jgi:hypothetical protein
VAENVDELAECLISVFMDCLRGSGFETELLETNAKLRHQGWAHTGDYWNIQNAKPR